MLGVRARHNEDTTSLLRRFRSACRRDGILRDMRPRPPKPSERRRQKARGAMIRRIRAERKARARKSEE